MCGIIYLMKITPKTNTIHFNVNGQLAIPHWPRKELGIKKGTRALVFQEGYDCGETHNTPLHQESAWLFERFGRAESANDKPQTRAGTLVSNFPTLNKSISRGDTRTVGEFPCGNSLSSFELHEFQPQMGSFTADYTDFLR